MLLLPNMLKPNRFDFKQNDFETLDKLSPHHIN